MTYESVVTQDQQVKEELSWWITNMKIYNGKSLLIVPPDLIIFSDASKKGWCASCQGITTGGRWSSVEKTWHINVLELEAARLAILSFKKFKKLNSIHQQIDNVTALSLSLLFIKHGRNPEQTFNRNLERNLGLPHREENTFDSRIYTKSEQSNSRLGIPKLPGQQRMETLSNCFRTNLQSFS